MSLPTCLRGLGLVTLLCGANLWAEEGLGQESGAFPLQTVQDALIACANVGIGREMPDDATRAEDLLAGMCIGVAWGVNTALQGNCWSKSQGANPSLAASPISVGATIQAFRNWAEQNPSSWDDDFAIVLVVLTAREFPCAD